MLKLADLLKELNIPKNKWVPVPANELDAYKKQIFDLIQLAYSDIGGHPNYQKPDDVDREKAETDFEVIDLDDDGDIDAISATKERPAGHKFVATGHDGSKASKSAVVNHKVDMLKRQGYYVEVSGKIKDIFLAKGVEPVTDEAVVRKALDGKQIEWHGDGTYTRKIGSEMHRKMLLGKPKA